MEALRKEFRLQNLGFGGVPASLFTSQKCGARWYRIYTVYRVVIAVYQLSWNIAIPIIWGHPDFYRYQVDSKSKWIIYLSNWSFCVLTLYLVSAAVSCLLYKRQTQVHDETQLSAADDTPEDGPTEGSALFPWYFKLTWILQNIAYSACAFVTVGYWFIEFKPGSTIVQIFTIHVHGISFLFGLVDVVLVSNPIRFLHFVYVYLYFLLYQIFALIYYKSGGTNPYGETHLYKGFIDWENSPTTSLIVLLVGTVLIAACFHGVFFGLAKIKGAIIKR
ncbi:protein rolling stone-like [Asterias rubens]|uniref:protein rolling stone-like n=1 Tax=Asterias rubens TaxID=7604 RepID=UPI00145534B3|nr:protein rolling stone-like [Asterias rubens]